MSHLPVQRDTRLSPQYADDWFLWKKHCASRADVSSMTNAVEALTWHRGNYSFGRFHLSSFSTLGGSSANSHPALLRSTSPSQSELAFLDKNTQIYQPKSWWPFGFALALRLLPTSVPWDAEASSNRCIRFGVSHDMVTHKSGALGETKSSGKMNKLLCVTSLETWGCWYRAK